MCDGDTKAIAEIKKDAPREVADVIEALLDLNHVSKNTGGKFRDLKGFWGGTTISDTVSSCLQKGFQSAVYTTREQMVEGEDEATQVARMKKNVRAVPKHYFDDHSNCGDWCKAKTDSNHRPHSLPYEKYLVDHRKEDGPTQRSFRADVDAIFEQYSSDAMCKKLLHNLPSNKCEAVHAACQQEQVIPDDGAISVACDAKPRRYEEGACTGNSAGGNGVERAWGSGA